MEEASVAHKLRVPEWQDVNVTTCDVIDAVGCKVTHELAHPKMCIVMDEVDGNTSQKGDGHIGGKLLVCGKGMVPQQKLSNKDKLWNLFGLPSLDGYPVMCVVVFAGERRSPLYETEMNVFAE